MLRPPAEICCMEHDVKGVHADVHSLL
jgi:hypothetical protein